MKRTLLFLFLFFSCGCTKVEFGYKLAPRVITSTLDDAFNFKFSCASQVRQQIETVLITV